MITNPRGINQWNTLHPLEHWLRLWSHVEKGPKCWQWIGAQSGPKEWPYGTVRWSGLNERRAHRIVYILTVGPIPAGLQVLHRCDNTLCVRPDHLFLGTQLDNMQDAKTKGRDPWSKMTHCSHGHPLSGDNIRLDKRGKYVVRRCQACHRVNSRASRIKRDSQWQ